MVRLNKRERARGRDSGKKQTDKETKEEQNSKKPENESDKGEKRETDTTKKTRNPPFSTARIRRGN